MADSGGQVGQAWVTLRYRLDRLESDFRRARSAASKHAAGLPVSTEVLGHLSTNVDVKNARLPLSYQDATQALAVCERVDECREWANKAEAIAAYARMADDETLLKTAVRIKARAIKRCGELLKQFQAPGARTDQPSTGADTRLTQREAAERAGMSKRQEATARNVANVPDDDFERMVESDDPPSVTQLAELGKISRPAPPTEPPKPAGFAQATQFIGEVAQLAARCRANPPGLILSGMADDGLEMVKADLDSVREWLNDFYNLLEMHG